MKSAGGFPNHPSKIIHIPFNEECSFTRFYEDRQLQQNIEGILQIREWARQAKEAAKRASKRKGKEEGTREMDELARSGMQKGLEFDICNKIFEIWIRILGRPLSTSVRSSDGAVGEKLFDLLRSV